MRQKMKYRIMTILLGTCSLTMNTTPLQAQKSDSLSALREFVSVSNGYKQLPLHLEIEMKNSTNFFTAEDDTTNITGEFYLRNENSYVRFGQFEQLINDSMALLVSDQFQEMLVYTNAGEVVNKMKSMMGAALPDSSLVNLSRRYTSFKDELSKESAVIKLKSRLNLPGTGLPKETIELKYDIASKMPQQVTMLTRKLLPLDSLQYSQLKDEKEAAGKLLTLEGSYFLMKEQITAYLYKQIEHEASLKVPVVISDRITKNQAGDYEPVGKYESYRITKTE